MKREGKWRRNVLFSCIRDLSLSMFSLFFTTCFSHQQVFDFVRDRNASVPVLTGATGECSSPESNVCAVGIRCTPVPGQSAKSAGDRSQLNTHAPYVCGCEWNDTLNWCVILWCTQNVLRDGSKITWHQQWNNLTTPAVSTQLRKNCSYKLWCIIPLVDHDCSELRSWVKVEVVVLGSLSLINLMA